MPAKRAQTIWGNRTGSLPRCLQELLGLCALDVPANGAPQSDAVDDLASLATAAAVKLGDESAHRLDAEGQQQLVELRAVVPVVARQSPVAVAYGGNVRGRINPLERLKVAGHRRAEADFDTGASCAVGGRDADDLGGAVG
jgi:hypothetical protein